MPKSSKKGRSKKSKGSVGEGGDIVDQRFVPNRPQFHTARSPNGGKSGAPSGLLVGGSSAGKVELDDRFAAALTDPRFRIGGDTGDVDKYGRKKSKKKKKKQPKGDAALDDSDDEGLGKFYTLKKKHDDDDQNADKANDTSDTSSDESEGDRDGDVSDKPGRGRQFEDDDDEDEDEEPNDPEARIAYLTALSRGEIEASSSSSDDDSSDDESSDGGDESQSDSDEDSLEGRAGVLDPSTKEEEEGDIAITDEPSPYLAVCNMDWSQVRAVDIFAILSSFCPPGSVKKVRVYPSDFGMERMKKEEIMGPQGIWKKQKNDKSADREVDDVVNERFSDDDESEDEEKNSISLVSDMQDDEDGDGDIDGVYDHFPKNPIGEDGNNGTDDFDPEKLRAYEASKMKYYFAVAEFASPDSADAAYREVDGMEVGHSSATIDLRSIPPSDIKSVIRNREIRDECKGLPSTYESPDFVVAALQQTAVRCTWEDGDTEREKQLTQYGIGNEAWAAMADGDDLRAYLASDQSSDDDSDAESDNDEQNDKGSRMRALLGLGSDAEENSFDHSADDDSEKSTSGSEDDDGFDAVKDNEEEIGVKTMTYIPGKLGLEDKIRNKLEAKRAGGEETKELTPWEKYQLKRKEKRKERRKAIRARRKDKLADNSDSESDVADGFDDENGEGGDDFFLDDDDGRKKAKKTTKAKRQNNKQKGMQGGQAPSTKEELELLIAGDNDEEAERDFDMRGIERNQKMKKKKLKGSRKRKEAEKSADVSGTAFQVDTTDSRFAAVLDGSDERFGIDRTDPSFKDTPAMQAVLAEQTKRRKKKRSKVANDISVDAINRSNAPTGGAAALSSLVKSLKTKVAKKK